MFSFIYENLKSTCIGETLCTNVMAGIDDNLNRNRGNHLKYVCIDDYIIICVCLDESK